MRTRRLIRDLLGLPDSFDLTRGERFYVEPLTALGSYAAAPLVEAAAMATNTIQEWIITETLQRMGEEAVRALVAALASRNQKTRLLALKVLNSRGAKEAVAPLTQIALSDPSPELRAKAISALPLCTRAATEFAPLNRIAYHDASPDLRCTAINALARCAEAEPVKGWLLGLLDDRDPTIVMCVVRAIGADVPATETVLARLLCLVSGSNGKIAEEALRALELMGRHPDHANRNLLGGTELFALQRWRPHLNSKVHKIAQSIADRLLAMFDQVDERLQSSIIKTLIAMEVSFDPTNFRSHPSPAVRKLAIYYFGFAPDATAQDVLQGIRDPDSHTRRTALRQLEEMPPSDIDTQVVAECISFVGSDAYEAKTALAVMERALRHSPKALGDADLTAMANLEPVMTYEREERWEPEAGWRPGDERYWVSKEDLTQEVRVLAAKELNVRKEELMSRKAESEVRKDTDDSVGAVPAETTALDVFISYSKQDPEPTRKLAHELETLGYRVWWDTNLVAGANFREVILNQLAHAKAVIVIWTPASVQSDWVISEADRARAGRKLVPLRVPAVGPHDIPMPFDTLHTEVVGDMGRLVQSLTVLGVAPLGRAPASLPSAVPRSATEYLNRGNTYFNNRDPDRAIADFSKAIELHPKYALAYYCRGVAWGDKGDHDRAIADYSKAIEFDPIYAAAYYNRGYAWGATGDQDRAIADYSKAIELDPIYVKAYNNQGNAWLAKGDHDRAIAYYSKTIELDPKYAIAYFNRGNAWDDKGDQDRAIADYTKAIELDLKDAVAYYNLGRAWRAKGDQDRAIADYTKAIELDLKDAHAFVGRGNAWHDKGDQDRAIADYSKAIELDPQFALAYNNRGVAWGDKGDHDRAIADYSKAIEFDPIDFLAYYNRGNAFKAKDRREASIADFRRALSENPSHQPSKDALKLWGESL